MINSEHVSYGIALSPIATMSEATISLNCFVLGDGADNVFTVKLPKTDNVSILKKMIKEEKDHLLAHIDVSDLELPGEMTPQIRKHIEAERA